ncbi:MAG: hypothetical protein U0P81_05450 [Holophagaceae bacterium]
MENRARAAGRTWRLRSWTPRPPKGTRAAAGASGEVGLTLRPRRKRLAGAGGAWTTAALGAKWTFFLHEGKRIQAARAAGVPPS